MYKYKEYLHPWIWISSVVWRTIFMFVFWTATLEHFHEYFLWPRRGSFSCSRNASFHVRVLPAILAAVVRLFKTRKSTFLLFVCPRYNVTWLRPGGHVYNIPVIAQFSSVRTGSMKNNGSRTWTSRSYTSKNVVDREFGREGLVH